MSHPEFESQIDAQLDGELGAVEAAALEAHLAGCAECVRFRDARLALRSAIGREIPNFRAPAALEARVRDAVRGAPALARSQSPARSRAWRGMALAASLAIVAAGAWRLGANYGGQQKLADEIVASHVRSLMPGHLTDVLSSDQHTVKPWFNGKIDFSPPVPDYAGRGYPLLGGRLDYVNGRSVAALVYGRRQHLINVFLWPSHTPARGAAEFDSHGYHSVEWTTAQYEYWVVSDLGLTELREFAALLQAGDSAATALP
jgi:anti-sigma factor RsiW